MRRSDRLSLTSHGLHPHDPSPGRNVSITRLDDVSAICIDSAGLGKGLRGKDQSTAIDRWPRLSMIQLIQRGYESS